MIFFLNFIVFFSLPIALHPISIASSIEYPASSILVSSIQYPYLCTMSTKPKPGLIWSILTMKCPRCRRGPMFNNGNAFKKLKLSHIFDMPERCPVCDQRYEMETGFWFGTGYVSYALAVAVTVATFVAGVILFNVSFSNNSIFYWLVFDVVFLLLIQPWLMRISRVIYIYIFVRYDEDYDVHKPKEFDS